MSKPLLTGLPKQKRRSCRSRKSNHLLWQRSLSGWHLDHPVNGQVITEDEQFTVAGWGLAQDPGATDLQCYVRTPSGTEVFKLDRRRQDVVRSLFKDQLDIPESVFHCGFRFACKQGELVSGMEFGFVANGEEIPVARFGLVTLAGAQPSLSRACWPKWGKGYGAGDDPFFEVNVVACESCELSCPLTRIVDLA
jgi:hypothetical protein